MSGPEAKNPAPAGISAPEDLDVADLFEQLREELRRGAGTAGAAGSEFEATRALAERFWPVSAEREAGAGPKGAVKRFLRKLMRWYVEPLAADQRVYNSSLLKLVDALSERADVAAAANERAEHLLRELEERLTRAARRAASMPMPTWSRMHAATGWTSSRPTSSSTWTAWGTAPSAACSWARSSSTCRRPCSSARSSSLRRSFGREASSSRRRSIPS